MRCASGDSSCDARELRRRRGQREGCEYRSNRKRSRVKREADTSKPHPGRVYDYILGGTQNFEADRRAAEAILKIVPSTPVMARVNRWFMQAIASRWAEEGRTRVLDLASGMP